MGMDVHLFYVAATDTLAPQCSIAALLANRPLHGVTRSTLSGEWGWCGGLIFLSALMLFADLLDRRNRGIPHIIYLLQRIMTQVCSWHQDLGLYSSSSISEQEISRNWPKTPKVLLFLV